MPNVTDLEQSYLTSALAEYAVPFHPSTLASIPTEMQRLDLFSLIPTDPQHFRPQMYLENLSGSMHSTVAPSTSSALVSSTSSSNYNASGHTATSIHDTRVITGGGGCTREVTGGSLSDIISLD
ncbi:hypothetical protein ATANTOWER_019237 [Ataeniobius toweri]|uniref:Uncharacterized protein n=1 Tax=Ataeniobius toweri TaxID=208326 RepID=A0ABU7AQ23_9TELE|nr:hypothetical protein [Ataeniobius toweri]